MDGAVTISWSFAKQNSEGKNRHGGRFLPAQGIEAEQKTLRFFVYGVLRSKTPCANKWFFVGADSPVFCGEAAKNAPKNSRKRGGTVFPAFRSSCDTFNPGRDSLALLFALCPALCSLS
jgi:hypothetical protein